MLFEFCFVKLDGDCNSKLISINILTMKELKEYKKGGKKRRKKIAVESLFIPTSLNLYLSFWKHIKQSTLCRIATNHGL